MREAVAGAVEPSLELRSHLDTCAPCRAAFTEERELFAAIDRGLHATANAEVPPSFLSRVGARLEDAPAADRHWTPFLIFAAASAAIALTLFIASSPRQVTNDNQAKQTLGVPFSETPAKPAGEEVVGARNTAVAMGARRAPQRIDSNSVSSASSAALEVIVPPHEREALTRFIDSQQERDVVAIALVVPASRKKDEPMSVEPLEIAELKVEPLEAFVSEVPDGMEEKQ